MEEQTGPQGHCICRLSGFDPAGPGGPAGDRHDPGPAQPGLSGGRGGSDPGPGRDRRPLKLVADKTFAEIPGPFAFIVPAGGAPTMRALGAEPLLAYVPSAGATAPGLWSGTKGQR